MERLDFAQRHMFRSSRLAGLPCVSYLLYSDVSPVEAKALYDYEGGSEKLLFSEGDMISVVDCSDSDWY
jgi:hypothetical protein